uniref:Uncharacterized protein n=1 Tax=Anopheles merus TaxID=30066 RepID=A0A182UM14_ANOME
MAKRDSRVLNFGLLLSEIWVKICSRCEWFSMASNLMRMLDVTTKAVPQTLTHSDDTLHASKDTMARHTLCPEGSSLVATAKQRAESFDLLDELELLLHRKGRWPVFLVTLIALALCFLVVGLLMATGIMLVTFLLFIFNIEPPNETTSCLNWRGDF